MTIRELVITFGYQIDKTSEDRANKAVESLKTAASSALETVGIKFNTDEASAQNVINKVNAIKESTESIENAISVGFNADNGSEQTVLNAVGRIKSETEKLADNIAGFSVNEATEKEVLASVDRIKAKAASIEKNVTAFSVDGSSKQNVLDAFEQLKVEAATLAENVVAYSVDGASEKAVADSMDALKDCAKPLENNEVGYEVNRTSEKTAAKSIKRLNVMGKKLLGAIGIGFSVMTAINAAKKFAAENEEIQDAVSNVRDEWNSWKQKIDETFNITRRLTRFTVRGLSQVMRVVWRLTDGFIRLGNRVGGIDRLLKLLAISAGAIFIALNSGKILTFINALGAGLKKVSIKMLAIIAVIVIIALLIEDLIRFMQGEDSLIGSLLEKFGIDGNEMRDTIRDIIDAVKGLLPFILELGKQLGGILLDVLKEILPFLIEIAKTLIPFIIDVIKELIPFIMQLIKDTLPVLTDLIKQLLPVAMEIIKSILPVIISLIQRFLPLVLEVIRKVLPAINNLIQRLLPLVVRLINNVLPLIINFIETLIPIVMRIIDAILPVIIRHIEQFISIMMQIIDRVLPVVIVLIEILIDAALFIINLILPYLMLLLENLIPAITFVAELLGSVLGAAFMSLMPIVDAVVGVFQGLIDFLTGAFAGNWSAAWIGLVNIFKNIIDGMEAIFKAPINAMIAGINTFLGGLSNISIPDWVPGVGGRSINISPIPMLAKGSDNAPDTFIAGEQGPELITNARGSKVFTASETVGIFNKIKDFVNLNFPEINLGIGGIAQILRDMAKLGATPAPETVAAVSGNTENMTVTQNVEITNQFHGDHAGQRRSAEAMDRAADDATSLLARGLTMVRG